MYIYDLPFEVHKELCRILDFNNQWRDLAAAQMKYTVRDLMEIEQQVRNGQAVSPTAQLFRRWGQLNHSVEELFILLYRMKNIPALKLLVPIVDCKFHKLLQKHERQLANNVSQSNTALMDENSNRLKSDGTDSSVPLPIMMLQKGVQLPTSSRNNVGGTNESSTDGTRNTSSTQGVNTDPHEDAIRVAVSGIPVLRYEELRAATNNWSDRNLLGHGGFGQVYKGEWKLTLVAVKRLKDSDDKNRELIRELCLNQYRHDNILPLYGYSLGGAQTCLVYQLMTGGSLEQRLRRKTSHLPLSWSQRHRIAHGIARGLQYLHTMAGTPLIHGDIKPANVLLDQCCIPKIGDFGLARKGPYGEERSHLKVSRVHGTRPYLPDEYLRSRCLSAAVDVFSFGVVMVEMATALLVMDRSRIEILLSDHIHKVANEGTDMALLEDKILYNTPNSNPMLCREFISIGLQCTKCTRQDRPAMLDVYKQLDALDFPGKNLS